MKAGSVPHPVGSGWLSLMDENPFTPRTLARATTARTSGSATPWRAWPKNWSGLPPEGGHEFRLSGDLTLDQLWVAVQVAFFESKAIRV